MEQPQPVNVQSVAAPEPHVESGNVGYERSNQYINSRTKETPAEDEHVFEEHTENIVSSRNTHEDTSGSASLHDIDLYHEDQAFEHNEVTENGENWSVGQRHRLNCDNDGASYHLSVLGSGVVLVLEQEYDSLTKLLEDKSS